MMEEPLEQQVAETLAKIMDPMCWGQELRRHVTENDSLDTKTVLLLAKRAWIRNICDNCEFPLNPHVRWGIISDKYILDPQHVYYRIIWATILATTKTNNSEERFLRIKQKFIDQNGINWWRDLERKYNQICTTLKEASALNLLPRSLRFAANRGMKTGKIWSHAEQGDFMLRLPHK